MIPVAEEGTRKTYIYLNVNAYYAKMFNLFKVYRMFNFVLEA